MSQKIVFESQFGETILFYDVEKNDLNKTVRECQKKGYSVNEGATITLLFGYGNISIYYRYVTKNPKFKPPEIKETEEKIFDHMKQNPIPR